MALIFHPLLASDFKFRLRGTRKLAKATRVAGSFHSTRRTAPADIGGYRTTEHYYPFDFKGRAWIDAGTYQVMRLEFELAKPIPAVGLTEQLEFINYAAVTFHSRKQQLWLPQSVEMYMERRGQRFYRIHTLQRLQNFRRRYEPEHQGARKNPTASRTRPTTTSPESSPSLPAQALR